MMGNATGAYGPSACGSLGFALADSQYADQVIVVTDNLVEVPCLPWEIQGMNVDVVVEMEKIGDPNKIVSGTTQLTKSPTRLLIAQYRRRLHRGGRVPGQAVPGRGGRHFARLPDLHRGSHAGEGPAGPLRTRRLDPGPGRHAQRGPDRRDPGRPDLRLGRRQIDRRAPPPCAHHALHELQLSWQGQLGALRGHGGPRAPPRSTSTSRPTWSPTPTATSCTASAGGRTRSSGSARSWPSRSSADGSRS